MRWKSETAKVFVVADDGNRNLFEQVGFKALERFELHEQDEVDRSRPEYFYFTFMVWEPSVDDFYINPWANDERRSVSEPDKEQEYNQRVRDMVSQHSESEDLDERMPESSRARDKKRHQHGTHRTKRDAPRVRDRSQPGLVVRNRRGSEGRVLDDRHMRAEGEGRHKSTTRRSKRAASRARDERYEETDAQALTLYQTHTREDIHKDGRQQHHRQIQHQEGNQAHQPRRRRPSQAEQSTAKRQEMAYADIYGNKRGHVMVPDYSSILRRG